MTPAADSKTAKHATQLPAFDWRKQWYPVHFACDLPEGKPQRVYIFDEPIVLLKRPGEQGVVALKDRCPHRAAALSEGRMTPDGQLQCAYHGWSFDGESGICTNIPQVRHLQSIQDSFIAQWGEILHHSDNCTVSILRLASPWHMMCAPKPRWRCLISCLGRSCLMGLLVVTDSAELGDLQLSFKNCKASLPS